MNILFIVGNGFDLNLGLATSYQQFYDYYCSLDRKDTANIKAFKEDILSKRYDFWSDLENGLGKYTDIYNNRDDYDLVTDDLTTSLEEFLSDAEKVFKDLEIDKESFFNDLTHPEEYLKHKIKDEIRKFKQSSPHNTHSINIINFNYTNIIEQILDDTPMPININSKIKDGKKYMLKGVDHIHGIVNGEMIIGVNDSSQISNTKLHDNIDIIETLIKQKHNEIIGENHDVNFSNKINSADLIIAFGLSFGSSDKIWWEKIGNRLKSNKTRMIIFGIGIDKNETLVKKTIRDERAIRDTFLNQTGLPEEVKKDLSTRIYVGVNKKIFKKVIKSNTIAGKLLYSFDNFSITNRE